jgi:ankyrin repeat protein
MTETKVVQSQAAKELSQRYNDAAIARRLFDSLKDSDPIAVKQVFARASEFAFELIRKGMDSTDMVNFRSLLASGLPTESRNSSSDTLLIAACKARDQGAIDTLLTFKADPKAVDDQGHDAAYWADMFGCGDMLRTEKIQKV